MAEYETYVVLEGVAFDAPSFQKFAAAKNVAGSAKQWEKRDGRPLSPPVPYWESASSKDVDVFDETSLQVTLRQVGNLLASIPSESPVAVTVVIVVQVHENVVNGGISFSAETIAALHEIGAEVDIDIVPKLEGLRPDDAR